MIKKRQLHDDERHTIKSALSVAAQEYDESAGEFKKLAAWIRAGKPYPMFAEGEPGARAADWLVEQFQAQAKEARAMYELIDEASEFTIISEAEDDGRLRLSSLEDR